MRLISTYLIGLVFGIGISISGMADPAKVLNFFDLFGTWDPSLAFVMGGGLLVTYFGYRFVFRQSAPVFETAFIVPKSKRVDLRLLGGSAVFGIGWGIAGFCPGGVLPVIGTGRPDVLVFVASLIAGMLVARLFNRPAMPVMQKP
ncbi:MAG: YeeE/YedE family protein [Alphaproteobacteria bacterium]|nr:YeeE/YedE family protein [Alphaproteobacteria bacterium]